MLNDESQHPNILQYLPNQNQKMIMTQYDESKAPATYSFILNPDGFTLYQDYSCMVSQQGEVVPGSSQRVLWCDQATPAYHLPKQSRWLLAPLPTVEDRQFPLFYIQMPYGDKKPRLVS